MIGSLLIHLVFLATSVAAPPPPPPLDPADGPAGESRLLRAPRSGELPRPGEIAFQAVGARTVRSEVLSAQGEPVTRLTRVGRAPGGARAADPRDVPWEVDLVAHLKSPTQGLPVILLLFDRADPGAVYRRDAAGAWPLRSAPNGILAARVRANGRGAFSPGHTYLALVVEVSERREVVLAEGEIRLE